MRRAACASAIVCVTSAAMLPAARADPPAAAGTIGDPDGRGYVEVMVAASDPDRAALIETLRELVGRLGLGLHAATADAVDWSSMGAPPRDAAERARVLVDELPSDHVNIAVSAVRASGASPPASRTVPKGASSAITTEQVAHVVHATIETVLATEASLLQASAPNSETPVAAPERPRTPQPARPRRTFGLDANAFATGRSVASNSVAVFGGGASVDVAARFGPIRPSVWIGGSYNAPFDVRPSEVTLETTVSSFRAIPSIEVVDLPVVEIEVGAGAGADVFHTVPSNPGTSVTLRPARDLVDPVLTGQVVARFRVAASARVLVGLDVDYDVGAHQYTAVNRSDTHDQVLTPWLVRPSALVGICVPLVGSVGCAGPE